MFERDWAYASEKYFQLGIGARDSPMMGSRPRPMSVELSVLFDRKNAIY